MNHQLLLVNHILLVNQTIGPLFAGVVKAAQCRASVVVFPGVPYLRTPGAARLFTWVAYSLQLAWHLCCHGRRYRSLLVVSNPPLAPLLAPLARCPYALLLYDLYPQVLAQLGLPPVVLAPITALWSWANRRVFASAERVFTLSDAMAAELRPAFASDALWRRKVVVIPPWADTSRLQPDPAAAAAFRYKQGIDSGRLLITYSGNLGLTHPLEPLVDAAALLAAAQVQLLLIGGGPKRVALEHRAAALQLPPVSLRFLDPLPLEDLPASLSAADLAMVALDGPAASASLPSKTFSALACGTPLLALAPFSSALAQLVQFHCCGVVIEPGPAAAKGLAAAITALAADRSRLQQLAANALAASRYYTPANAERLLDAWLGG
jgi:colanic acid biosynthesis glycosyl transferase WcaI